MKHYILVKYTDEVRDRHPLERGIASLFEMSKQIKEYAHEFRKRDARA